MLVLLLVIDNYGYDYEHEHEERERSCKHWNALSGLVNLESSSQGVALGWHGSGLWPAKGGRCSHGAMSPCFPTALTRVDIATRLQRYTDCNDS